MNELPVWTARMLLGVVLMTATAAFGADDDASLRAEVKQLRDDVAAMKEEMQAIRKAMGPRRTATGWEVVEGMTIHPEGAPQLGHAEAPWLLIEFSDYQCPFCARYFSETMPQIRRDFIDTGRLRYMVADYPIERLHPLALKAAEAAHCAADQGRFWEMHDRLFKSQRNLEPWSGHAEALGIDVARFTACLESGHYADEIRTSAAQAQRAGVNSTPVFLLAAVRDDGIHVVRRLRGAAPYEVFRREIEALLAEGG